MRLRGSIRLAGCVAAVVVVLGTCASRCLAEVRLPRVFSSHMVVQRGKPVAVWGWAQPGETVTVEMASEKGQAQANDKGEWKLELPAIEAGGPYTMKVSGSTTVEFEDVMVGEVWLCSGQSNMEMGIGMVNDAKEEIAAANYPNIRLLMVPNRWTPEPQDDIEASWKACSPETIAENGWSGFSAAAYFFGRELHKKLGVAVGLIDATWGGTRIEPWTPPEGFAEVPSLNNEYEQVELADPRTATPSPALGPVSGTDGDLAEFGPRGNGAAQGRLADADLSQRTASAARTAAGNRAV